MSVQIPKKPLKFIHITKCAGTSIENAAKKAGINWGRHHREYGFHHRIFPNIHPAISEQYDWFMVVRNPYTRILSEYHCRWGGIGATTDLTHTVAEMNSYLVKKIMQRSRSGNHYTEQFRYCHPTIPIHIIKFENLQSEFDALMATYTITGLVLEHENANPKLFTVSDFSPELLTLINQVYDQDFTTFGYEKMSATAPASAAIDTVTTGTRKSGRR